jgi:hypothetical protein
MKSAVSIVMLDYDKYYYGKILEVGHPKSAPPTVLIGGIPLELVETYKYLGVHLNCLLSPSEQWQLVYSKVNSLTALLRELKLLGWHTSQLISAYRAYGLTHFDYSAVVLMSCTETEKLEMTRFQNRVLQSIGISQFVASTRYRIKPICQRIDDSCSRAFKRIIADPTHPITAELKVINAIQTRNASKYDVPRAKTAAFGKSFLMTYLRTDRDGQHDLYTNDGSNRLPC